MPSTKQLVRSYVDPDLAERYAKRFGDYSSVSFIVENAMRELLELTEGQPDMEDLVRQAIRIHVLKTRSSLKSQGNDNTTSANHPTRTTNDSSL